MINPADPNQYKLDGQWKQLQPRDGEIPVRQADGSIKTDSHTLLHPATGRW